MNQYLQAVGFGKIRSIKDLYLLISDTEKDYTHHELVYMEKEIDFCEYRKEYGSRIGMSVYGYLDETEHFESQYYVPFLEGTGITSTAEIFVDRRMDREAYIGICEDTKVGISLIFHLQNTLEYLREIQLTGDKVTHLSVTLAGLCNSGTILLPVKKDVAQQARQREEVLNRRMLMDAAKTGDPEAIESLTLDDIDTYSQVSKRLITEDVFSIVDTYIMPYGAECDRYSILGEIRSMETVVNAYSGEKVYIMKVDVNELTFDICVPVSEVVGEPAVGRRFKANMWLQGRVNM